MPYRYPFKYGKYLLTRRIAVGGMAEVFKAKLLGPRGFEKTLAIKRILPEFGEDEDFVSMFVDEARISSGLHHSNIVQVFDFGQVEDSYYLAMEYVDGPNLRNLFQKSLKQSGKFSSQLAMYIALHVAKALEYAHAVGLNDRHSIHLVHRDISPQNILVSREGEIKLTDFGIAKATIKLSRTQPGKVQGKLSYMSPEQATGKKVDHRSDIFSLGIILYELLSSTKVYANQNTAERYGKIRNAHIAPLQSVVPDIPDRLDQLIMSMLDKDPENRPANSSIVIRALTELISEPNHELLNQELKDLVAELIPAEKSDSEVNQKVQSLIKQQEHVVKESEPPGTEVRKNQLPPIDFEKSEHHTQALPIDGEPHSLGSLWGWLASYVRENKLNAALIALATLIFVSLPFLWLVRENQKKSRAAAPLRAETSIESQSPPENPSDSSQTASGPLDIDLREKALARQIEVENRLKELENQILEAKKETEKTQKELTRTKKELDSVSSRKAAPASKVKCPSGMVYLKRGSFQKGSKPGDPDRNDLLESPLKKTSINASCMDRYEYPNQSGKMPVVNVSLKEAQSRCQQKGKRLCTSNEWERACKGLGGDRRFPFGDSWEGAPCNARTEDSPSSPPIQTSGSFSQCKSPDGLFDLSGNVSEWTQSQGQFNTNGMIVKGGSSSRPIYQSRCAAVLEIDQNTKSPDLGFRCCKNPQ